MKNKKQKQNKKLDSDGDNLKSTVNQRYFQLIFFTFVPPVPCIPGVIFDSNLRRSVPLIRRLVEVGTKPTNNTGLKHAKGQI